MALPSFGKGRRNESKGSLMKPLIANAVTVFILGLVAQIIQAQGNLVFDGGFDVDASGWTITNGGPGYDSTKGDPGGWVILESQNPTPTSPSPTISQAINDLVPGQPYTVSGDFQKVYDPSGGTITGLSFGVAIDGIYLFEASDPQNFNWQSFSFSYTTTTSGAVLSLSSQLNGAEVSYGIDNIGIFALREPSAKILSGCGILLLVFCPAGV
jgi:hypothetical protein